MIESLADHGVIAMDLVPALMTTHTVANPEYDPAEAQRQADLSTLNDGDDDNESVSDQTLVNEPISPIPDRTSSKTPTPIDPSPSLPTIDADNFPTDSTASKPFQTTTKVLKEASTAAIPGVTTSLSAADERVTLDIRWTVLCDLFLILIADSVYDARSRVLLEHVAIKLGLGWLDVVKFESRVTEALEIQEDVESLEQQDIVEGAAKAGRRRRYMMLGLATIGMFAAFRSLRWLRLLFRWWIGHWSLCRSFGACYWPWTCWCSYDCRCYGDRGLPWRYSWCCCHHYWRRSYRVEYRRPGYGRKDEASPNIRYPPTTQ